MSWYWPALRRRIALTGLFNSGKTVFLTSLLDHLSNNSPLFHLGDGNVSITHFKEYSVPGKYKRFDFRKHRQCIFENHRFPQKTVEPSAFCFTLRRSDHTWDYQVELIDFPGERFTDASMVSKTYDDWSDSILAAWSQAGDGLVPEYLSSVREESVSREQVVNNFKEFLAKRLLSCQPHVCPSVFKLNGDHVLRGRSVADVLSNRPLVGLSSEKEFAPIPEDTRTKRPELAKGFAESYDAYRREYVEPFFNDLGWCDRLIVLVDIPSMLQYGPGAVEDNHDLLESILSNVALWNDPLSRLGKSIANVFSPATYRWGGVEKVAFVATKCDLIYRQDRDNVLALLKSLVRRAHRVLNGTELGFFDASAIVSTAEEGANGNPKLTARLRQDRSVQPPARLTPNDEPRSFSVSRVPEEFPNNWPPPEFVFEDVFPAVPKIKFTSPKHSNLDKVFDFVLS